MEHTVWRSARRARCSGAQKTAEDTFYPAAFNVQWLPTSYLCFGLLECAYINYVIGTSKSVDVVFCCCWRWRWSWWWYWWLRLQWCTSDQLIIMITRWLYLRNAHNTVFGSKRSAICATVELSYNVFFKWYDLHISTSVPAIWKRCRYAVPAYRQKKSTGIVADTVANVIAAFIQKGKIDHVIEWPNFPFS